MLPAWFTIFSIAIRLGSGAQYAWSVVAGRSQPNPISWFLWGLTPLIAFFAQLQYGLNAQAWVLLALATSPLIISLLTVVRNGYRQHFTPFATVCGILALLGIVLWQVTSIPELAIVFSILADTFASLPTIQKAYNDPSSEYSWPYALSAFSMVITLLTIHQWVFAIYAFPLYMLLINVTIFTFSTLPLRRWVNQKYRHSPRKLTT